MREKGVGQNEERERGTESKEKEDRYKSMESGRSAERGRKGKRQKQRERAREEVLDRAWEKGGSGPKRARVRLP